MIGIRVTPLRYRTEFPIYRKLQRRGLAGKFVVMAADFPPAAIRLIAGDVVNLLKERKETISVAETVCRRL